MRGVCHFIRLCEKHPYVIASSGKLVAGAVEDEIPYRISGGPRCQPVEPTREVSIPCFLERVRDIAGLDPKPATPARPKKDDAEPFVISLPRAQ